MSLNDLTQTLRRAYDAFKTDPTNSSRRHHLHDAYMARGFGHEENGLLPMAFWDYARADVVSSECSFDALQSLCQCALEMRWYGEAVEIANRAIVRLEHVFGGLEPSHDAFNNDNYNEYVKKKDDVGMVVTKLAAARRFFVTMREEAARRAERDRVFFGSKRDCFISLRTCAKYASLKNRPPRKIVYRSTVLDVRPSRSKPDTVGIHATVKYRTGDRILVDPPLLTCHVPETPACDHCGNDLSLYANTFTSCLFACGACFCSRPCIKSALETHHPTLCRLEHPPKKHKDIETNDSLPFIAMKKLIALSIGTKTALLSMSAITDPLVRDLAYYPTTNIPFEWSLAASLFNFLASVDTLHDPDFDLPHLLLAFHVIQSSLVPLHHPPRHDGEKKGAVAMHPLKMRYLRYAKYGNVRKEGDKLFATRPIQPDDELLLPLY